MGDLSHEDASGHHAWDPGIRSAVPRKFLDRVSMYRPENSARTIGEIEELAAFTGLEADELVVFRPQRLALHSLLIRITANVRISDGDSYQDLGINFRRIAGALEDSYLRELLPRIEEAFDSQRLEIEQALHARFQLLFPKPSKASNSDSVHSAGWRKWFKDFLKAPEIPKPAVDPGAAALAAIDKIEREVQEVQGEVQERSLRSLAKVLKAVSIKHGNIRGDADVLVGIAADMTMNIVGSETIGGIVEERFAEAVVEAGFQLLPHQEKPVVMNVKGSSAAGKSTMRPLQQKLAKRLGFCWEEFALISPDIWRKYLLDYDNLDDAWRYAGSLSGQELKFVDRKLDLYMTMKERQGRIPHMLIDRFRFDSFAEVDEQKGEGRLLTRFGHEIFMTFMVTPPEDTVQRAWQRGLKVQRYKPVEDLLDHNVEAYSGMPPLFFRWATRTDRPIHYEILDNSVPEEDRPLTIAFGEAQELTVFWMKGLFDIDRFRKINIQARSPDEVYSESEQPEKNTGFLLQCVSRLQRICLADAEKALVYARIEQGSVTVLNEQMYKSALLDPWMFAGIAAIDKGASEGAYRLEPENCRLNEEDARTLGQWGNIPKKR